MQNLDLHHLCYSKRGSFLKIGAYQRESGRLMIGTSRDHPYIDQDTQGSPVEYYEIALFQEGAEISYEAQCCPWEIGLMVAGSQRARITFLDDDTVLFEIYADCSLVLLPCHSIVGRHWVGTGFCNLIDYRGFCVQQVRAGEAALLRLENTETVEGLTGPYDDTPVRISFSPEQGKSALAALRLKPWGGLWEEQLPLFDAAADRLREEWQGWLGKMPGMREEFRETAEAAWWLLWSNTARAEGHFQREPMLVSNYWFNRLYAWDNCFHALGVVEADPELACAQLQIFYDNQAPNGALPEPISDQRRHFAYIKPPVHGWCVLEMLREVGTEALKPHLPGLYEGIAKWTRWWFDERDSNGNGLAEYIRGMDSGWDNATPFDIGEPVEGADLAAHLVLQTEALAEMARLLDKPNEEQEWRALSRNHLETFLGLRWRDDRFTSPGVEGEREHQGNSLMDRMPLELGPRLPEAVRAGLLHDLRDGGAFLGSHGLATEDFTSPKFDPKGYWRGPIWPSATYLLFTGLRDLGETGLCQKIADRYCAMVAQDNAFWENFNPVDGSGNSSPAIGWTAAVYLRLARWLSSQ